jgi:hypothetical protein
MLPPQGAAGPSVRPIIAGFSNGNADPQHQEAIKALGDHLGLTLDRARCDPYWLTPDKVPARSSEDAEQVVAGRALFLLARPCSCRLC